MQKKLISEGSEFTVGVEVKNSTGREINNLVVKDFIPTVFTAKDAQGIRADKRKTDFGTTLTWRISSIRNGEERLFSYKIVPVLGVGGQMSIPSASVTYERNGKQ